MLIREVMTPRAECTRPTASLRAAAEKMRDLDVGPLPVCSDDDQLVGILTDRDITIRAVADGHDPNLVRVEDVMTPEVYYCFDDHDVQQAAEIMKDRQVRRLVVLNRGKRLVGIVSIGDLAVETGDDQLVGDTIEEVSIPIRPK
ncbi:MAG: CBS domain-containing protein [Pirellulaceae bacterium]